MSSSLNFERVDVDAIIIGAGFSGVYAAHRLRNELGLSIRAFDAGTDFGGTWHANRYPGARVDIESIHYSYSFDEDLQQEWKWSERFAGQPELQAYISHVADKYDLRKSYEFETRVISAKWSDDDSTWRVETDKGEFVTAKYVVASVGPLSVGKKPEFSGIDSFGGELYWTGEWPEQKVDFAGKRVAVIGTGSSGIQIIPQIAQDADQLFVFQRTPNYITPLQNRPHDESWQPPSREEYRRIREASRNHPGGFPDFTNGEPTAVAIPESERRAVLDRCWNYGGFSMLGDSFQDVSVNEDSNAKVAEFLREKVREQVQDPEIAELLTPRGYPYGTKRPVLDTGYYESFNRDNVTLVDVRESPIESITPTGILTATTEYSVDIIVLATGFDALTGPLANLNVTGRGGVNLAEKFHGGVRTYMGFMSAGFPNLFMIIGPQSPGVAYSTVLAIEDHVDYMHDIIKYLTAHQRDTIEASSEAEDAWVEHVNEVVNATLIPRGPSWYMGANIPGKPRECLVYFGGAVAYRAKWDEIVANDYQGFNISASRELVPAK